MSKENLVILPHVFALFAGFVGPLVTFLVGEGDLKEHSKKALNWQLSFLIYVGISFILMFVLIGMLIIPVLMLMNLVFCILAAVKASNGEAWDYPATIHFLK